MSLGEMVVDRDHSVPLLVFRWCFDDGGVREAVGMGGVETRR